MRVLIVEDDRDLAETLIQYLEIEQFSCDYASNGVEGLNLGQQVAYDVIVLDLNLPRMDGISVCEHLRNLGNRTPILMLTARDQLDDTLAGFAAGTDDYLIKPFAMLELVARLKALATRQSGQVKRLQVGDLIMDLNSGEARRNDQLLKLTPTGWKLLETLMRASPSVISRETLEDAVWGDEPPDSNSLKVHMHHLRKCINEPFASALIHTIPNKGFSCREISHEN